MPLNDIQLKWIVDNLTKIHHGSPWNVRAELEKFISLLESRLPKE